VKSYSLLDGGQIEEFPFLAFSYEGREPILYPARAAELRRAGPPLSDLRRRRKFYFRFHWGGRLIYAVWSAGSNESPSRFTRFTDRSVANAKTSSATRTCWSVVSCGNIGKERISFAIRDATGKSSTP